jgi:hypothetical protein
MLLSILIERSRESIWVKPKYKKLVEAETGNAGEQPVRNRPMPYKRLMGGSYGSPKF